MKNPIRSPRFPQYAADAHDLYAFLGVKKLPDEGMPERLIQGVRVYVKPLVRIPGLRRNFNGLRVMAICKCNQHIAVGRLHQHKCWHDRFCDACQQHRPCSCDQMGRNR